MEKLSMTNQKELTRSIILIILFLGLFNYDLGSIQILYWGITLGCSGLLLLLNQKWSFDGFMLWFVLFLTISATSVIWSIERTTSLAILKPMIVQLLVLFSVNNVIRKHKDVITVLRAMLIAFVLNTVYIITKIDWAAIGTNRLDTQFTGEGWNANSLGLIAVWGLAITIILPRKKGVRAWEWLYIAALIVILIFSGSRKAWIGAICVFVLGLIIKNQKKMFKTVLITTCAIVVFVVLIMNVPLLYEIGGHRFEEMLAGLLGTGEADSSTILREAYGQLGLEWFQNRPILGHGADTFQCLLSTSYIGRRTYSHNNYVELLVNGGLIALIAFYSIYLWVILKGFLQSYKKSSNDYYNKRLLLFLVGLIAIQLIMHLGFVAYSDLPSLLFLLVTFKLIILSKSQKPEQDIVLSNNA